MALPSEFPLSAFQVRSELGIASNLSISMLSAAVRALAGQPDGDVKFSELRGKSNRVPMFDVLVVGGGGHGCCGGRWEVGARKRSMIARVRAVARHSAARAPRARVPRASQVG